MGVYALYGPGAAGWRDGLRRYERGGLIYYEEPVVRPTRSLLYPFFKTYWYLATGTWFPSIRRLPARIAKLVFLEPATRSVVDACIVQRGLRRYYRAYCVTGRGAALLPEEYPGLGELLLPRAEWARPTQPETGSWRRPECRTAGPLDVYILRGSSGC